MPTGGEIRFARSVRIDGEEAVLVQAGSTLQLIRRDGGSIWRKLTPPIGNVLHVDDFDGRGGQQVLVTTDKRTVVLLDLGTGQELWAWQSEPSTFISGYRFHRTKGGLRFICFPNYDQRGHCFDFSESLKNPRKLWETSFRGRYEAGYGPNIVLADMGGDGTPDVVVSSKSRGRVYQAVVDIDTGTIKYDVHYEADPPAPHRCGRPYGLLTVADADGDGVNDIVLVSCQVEEYAAVTGNVSGKKLTRLWGKFVEKDWPEDKFELRPQVTSVADVQGEGKPELVLGRWDGKEWRTFILDLRRGFETRRAALRGYYFWGCHDLNGDGAAEVIVSREKARRPSRITRLAALSGRTLQPLAELERAAVFGSTDSTLPVDVAFMALRSSPVFFRCQDKAQGILVRRYEKGEEKGVFLWGARQGSPVQSRPVAGPGFTRADVSEADLLLSTPDGRVQRFGADLKPDGKPLSVNGRFCTSLVCATGGKRQLIVDAAGDEVLGGTPDLDRDGHLLGRWRIRGAMPATHVDAMGRCRLAVADLSDPDEPAVVIYPVPPSSSGEATRVALTHPPYLGLVPFGRNFLILVNLRTGVHTNALACYGADGKLRWQDPGHGAHPNIPGAADLNGDGIEETVSDDHGQLRIYDPKGNERGYHKGWPPAYTLPISGAFGPEGKTAVLRASGIDGMSLNDPTGKPIWSIRKPVAQRWRWHQSLAAIADVTGGGAFSVGLLAEDDVFECFEASTGRLRWSIPLGTRPMRTSVVAGDVDGDGADEFLTGLPDGRLLCLKEVQAKGTILWEKQLEAAIANPILADIDGDGSAEILLSTADGFVRILAPEK